MILRITHRLGLLPDPLTDFRAALISHRTKPKPSLDVWVPRDGEPTTLARRGRSATRQRREWHWELTVELAACEDPTVAMETQAVVGVTASGRLWFAWTGHYWKIVEVKVGWQGRPPAWREPTPELFGFGP